MRLCDRLPALDFSGESLPKTRVAIRVLRPMRAGWIGLILMCISLVGCGKSRKLTPLLPDPPEGWSAEGSPQNKDISGVGHSSTKSYLPVGNMWVLGVREVKVQILVAEKDADWEKLRGMSLQAAGEFMKNKQVGGFPADESIPMDSDHFSLIITPRTGTWVQIIAYKGRGSWNEGANREATVLVFANQIDLKKIAALE
jgi:hypothetical protein